MTLILAALKNGHVVMGGDRCFSFQSTGVAEIYTSAGPKIWRSGDVLLGCSGSRRLRQLFQEEMPEPSGPLAKWIAGPVSHFFVDVRARGLLIDDRSMLLAATATEIIAISYADQSWAGAQQAGPLSFTCIGSGRHWAYGSCCTCGVLDVGARDTVRLALEATAKHCATVAAPFDFLELGGHVVQDDDSEVDALGWRSC
jgi:ATP-dependent protease HslVU (ClpYQ) peptidase subunit